MTYKRAFVGVRTDRLAVDRVTSASPAKWPDVDIRDWMTQIPNIYDLQLRDVRDVDFKEMRERPRDRSEALLGATYQHLFSTSPSARPIIASCDDTGRIVVDSGQHRVLAAQRLGIPVLPVHIAAPSFDALDRVRQEVEQELRDMGPRYAELVELHRLHDLRHYPERNRSRLDGGSGERHPGRERLEPERERDWRIPERER